MTARYRILLGQIFQETHGYTPLLTDRAAFVMESGASLLQNNRDAESVLGGLIRAGTRFGWALVPAVAARASPGGRVTDRFYTELKQAFLAAASVGEVDGVALCLHGCMQTESLDSAEADLLAALRQVLGPNVPLVAGFDLHAHASGGMLRWLDFCSAYKTNPHRDASATGERVAGVLDRMLSEGLKPVGAAVQVPMLTGGNDETASGPLARLHAQAAEAVSHDPHLLDASIFNVNPFIDGAGVGQTTVVYASSASHWQAAATLAETLADGLWAARAEFRHQLPSVQQVLETTPGTLVLGDFGDRVLAGAPGDSVQVADQLRQLAPERRVIAPVTDPLALARCQQAGEGARLALQVGGAFTPGLSPLACEGVVRRLGEGTFRNRGAFMQGATLQIGPYAVFESGKLQWLITREPLMSQDPGCFLDTGFDLSGADVIVVKSGYHYKMAFGAYGSCLNVASPGLSAYDPGSLGLVKARPIYPLDEMAFSARADRVGTG